MADQRPWVVFAFVSLPPYHHTCCLKDELFDLIGKFDFKAFSLMVGMVGCDRNGGWEQ